MESCLPPPTERHAPVPEAATLPSKTFLFALATDAIVGTVLTFVGLLGFMPLPWWQTLAVFVYAMGSCLVLNDAVLSKNLKSRPIELLAPRKRV